MREFGICVLYFALTGIAGFFLGRILPKGWFRYDRFPYKALAFEREGKIYEALGIRRWKDVLPDMSKILPGLIPSRKLSGARTPEQVELLLQETCIAECIHCLLCISGIACIFLWKGAGGWILYGVYVLGNLPFNLIQRYNRPKLARIYRKCKEKVR